MLSSTAIPLFCRDHVRDIWKERIWKNYHSSTGSLGFSDSISILKHWNPLLVCQMTDLALCSMQMQHAYDEYNEKARATGKSRGHFMVDLCRPGHMTACLRNFQEATHCSDDTWESQFGEDASRRSQLSFTQPHQRPWHMVFLLKLCTNVHR